MAWTVRLSLAQNEGLGLRPLKNQKPGLSRGTCLVLSARSFSTAVCYDMFEGLLFYDYYISPQLVRIGCPIPKGGIGVLFYYMTTCKY